MKKAKAFAGFIVVIGSVSLISVPAVAHNGDHPFIPGSQASNGLAQDGKVSLEAQLGALNGSDSTGTASVTVEDGRATVKLRTVSASKDMPHAQHIHIGGANQCPTSAADTNGDGFVSVVEGVPFYGGIAVSLTTSGDVSGASGLALDRFPTANGNFVVDYQRTFDLPTGVTASDIANGVIVQHGISELFDDNYRYDGSKESSIAPGVPFEATVPSACGKLVAAGTPAWGLTGENTLLTFSTTNPSQVLNEVSFTGLAAGETILGIDARPATGKLYGLGSTKQLYVIDPTTGAVTPSGAPLDVNLIGDKVGLDFNPTVDRLRITTNGKQNLRVNVDTGAVTVDGSLSYANGDAKSGSGARIVASAYTNNFAGATSTTLFNLDADANTLVSQLPPNNGTLNTIGSLGFDVTDLAGFDISPTGVALAVVSSGGPSELRSVDLATGATTSLGKIGDSRFLKDIAISG